jgi:hypothetical protein
MLLAAFLVLAPSVQALGDPPASTISTPPTASIGGSFMICINGTPGSMAMMFIASELGSTPTKFGTMCIKLPALAMALFQIPSSGELCFPCNVPCMQGLVGFTAHLTAIIGGPGPGQGSVTNCSSITVVDTGLCGPPPPQPGSEPGDFVSFTQGAYGGNCAGNSPACMLQANFASVFPSGLLMGDPDGIDGDGIYALLLTSATAVKNFLPEGMPRDPFDQDLTDPTSSSAGVLGGQLTAAMINVAFDAAGVFDSIKAYPGIDLGDLVYVSGVEPVLIGKSVNFVIALANQAISGAIPMPTDVDMDTFPDLTFPQLNTAVAIINTNFDNGTANQGHLLAP